MTITNTAQPFNVGVPLYVRPIGSPDMIQLDVVSWKPGIDVNTFNPRRQSVTVPWEVAVKALRRVQFVRYGPTN